ncbi:hypothetical protein [Microcoleus sp. BROC3]
MSTPIGERLPRAGDCPYTEFTTDEKIVKAISPRSAFKEPA